MAEKFVSIIDVYKLRKVFKEKKWNQIPNEENVFSNLCKILNSLSEGQKTLIHELVEKYEWISSNEYYGVFFELLKSIDESLLRNCKNVYLFPLVKPDDVDSIKSGHHCVYLFHGLIAGNQLFNGINKKIITTFEELKALKFNSDGTDLLFLIDDFIGTGNTFIKVWDEIKQNDSISSSYILTLTLIIQQSALDLIERECKLNIISAKVMKKGISDEYESPLKEEKISLMNEIESYIKPKAFSFGYEKSEALVTMIRTPNNTFPFFWMESKINGERFDPPFPRF